MVKILRENLISSIVRSVAIIALSLLILFDTIDLLRYLGLALAIVGISRILYDLAKERGTSIGAYFDLFVGLGAFANPELVAKIVLGGIGFIFIIIALARLILMLLVHRSMSHPLISFVYILILILGIVLVLSDLGQNLIRFISGIFLFVYGINSLIENLLLISKKPDNKEEKQTYSYGNSENKTYYKVKVDNTAPQIRRDDDELDTSNLSDAKDVYFSETKNK